MRYVALIFSFLLLLAVSSTHRASAVTSAAADGVVIQKKTIVIVRTGRLAKDLSPERKKVKVSYPVITSGTSSPEVLAKIRALLKLENVFGTSLKEHRQDTWLSELDYKVNYNKNFVLDITFRQEGVGAYPDSDEKHFAINIRTGELVKAADVFKPEKLAELAALVDRKLQAEIKETVEQVNKDKSISAEERESVPGLFENLKIEDKDLDDFLIDDAGVTFLYDAGFAHAVQAYQPVGAYKFSYAELASFLKREGAPQNLIQ